MCELKVLDIVSYCFLLYCVKLFVENADIGNVLCDWDLTFVLVMPYYCACCIFDGQKQRGYINMDTKAAVKGWLKVAAIVICFVIPGLLICFGEDAGFAPIRFLFSGRAFGERGLIVGGSLDQPSLEKEIFIFAVSLLFILPALAIAQKLSRTMALPWRMIITIASLVLMVHPVSVLTIYSYDISRYINAYGITPQRMIGLAMATAGYILLIWFVLWLLRSKNQQCDNNTVSTLVFR